MGRPSFPRWFSRCVRCSIRDFQKLRETRERAWGAWPFFVLTVLAQLQGIAKLSLAGVLAPSTHLYLDRWSMLSDAVATARSALPDGLVLEFGVATGESISFIAERAGSTVWGFDSFEGLPEGWGPFYPRGSFSSQGRIPSVGPGVRLVKGWFGETLPAFLTQHPSESVALLHIDSDLYESARTVLSALSEKIRPGTVIVFDEYCSAVPDDEFRAFKEVSRARGWAFKYLSCGAKGTGSLPVGLQIL